MRRFKYLSGGFKAAAVATVAALVGIAGFGHAQAADKAIKVGITLPLTGADAEDANKIKNGAMMAIEEANASGAIPGYKIEVVVYDSGTATAGQYDPAQAATIHTVRGSDRGLLTLRDRSRGLSQPSADLHPL